ncbi:MULTISPECIES: Ig-like domain-containing protein [unclassified Pseudomonas]|uniref:Ig-like domain-containing protein n=1 Tax=unclassified Pseudomonas TaxID=196821 RepID=UPI0021C9068A|nr:MULTISPECIES: Ig-like domain-containing protein [unclassified Pseudomonas]MCU1734773.1 Ig-like domain-containing protein [Pseudomonas sp. 20P_3.2_Bac4]MCU1745336.1 Ig-like domain-containing protein [Pseudomonas sp. 20P_3.2_Bac5]
MSNSNHSIDELLAWLDGKSRTFGHGCVVAYDQRKTNKLLSQIYIERFNSTNGYLPLINQTMDSGDASKEFLSNLKLSAPKLLFSNADLDDSRATLTMDFVGGLIMTVLYSEGAAARISRIQKILPIGGPQLSMVLDLERVKGAVGDTGQVALKIAEGREYKANFVLGDIPQEQVGAQFKLLFEGLRDDQKIFPLGTLSGDLNGPLTPESFEIRTMPAPGATRRGADNYGHGAVLLFVRLKGDADISYPGSGSDFKYPIPADKNGKEYTGTVLLSSRVLFNDLIAPHAEADIGHGIKFKPYAGGTDIASSLQATAGGLVYNEFEVFRDLGNRENVRLIADYNFEFSKGKPFTVQKNGDGLIAEWNPHLTTSYWFKEVKADWFDDEKTGTLECGANTKISIKARLDTDGVVVFESDSTSRLVWIYTKVDQELRGLTYSNGDGDDYFTSSLKRQLSSHFDNFLHRITAPNIDTFLIRNLLFPGHNALQLHDVYVPGDLALFGHIDPLRTTVVVSPLQVTLLPGASQKFTLDPAPSDANWSVRSTEPGETNVGTIDASGVYKAPAASSLKEGSMTVVVTGKGKLDGQDVTSSALVSVMEHTVTVSPIFEICESAKEVALTAGIMGSGNPAWSLKTPALGGKLSTNAGGECVYTAAPVSSDRDVMYVETVQVKNPTANDTIEVQLLVLRPLSINMPVLVSEDSKPETGQVQLHVGSKNGPVVPPPGAICKLLVSGGGTLSPTGVFKEPANAKGFAVISVVIPGDFSDHNGFIVLPLPLSAYADISRRASDSIQAHAMAAAPDLP